MARDIQIYGECLVRVYTTNFGGTFKLISELGLSSEPIIISFKSNYREVLTSDYGEKVPAELLYELTEAKISMTLVHWDDSILEVCLRESLGGAATGTMTGAGTPLGGMGEPRNSLNNHFIQLDLHTPNSNLGGIIGWRFHSTYLAETPLELPIGTERSLVKLVWRAIPYKYGIDKSIPSTNVMNIKKILEGNSAVKTKYEITSKGTILYEYLTSINLNTTP